MKKTGIMTDSHSGILPEEAERLGIRVLPMPFYIGEKLYREGVDLSRDEFYDMLRKGVDVSTSQPSPAEVIDMWKEMLKEYEEIVYIPLSSALSGSCMAAAAMANDDAFAGKVFVVDNGRVATPMHRSVLDAVEMVEKGYSAAEIKKILEETREKMTIYIGLSTLEYLKKGGRISSVTALAANVLNIKPVMHFSTGKLDTYQKCRGLKKSRKVMIDAMKEELETNILNLTELKNLLLFMLLGTGVLLLSDYLGLLTCLGLSVIAYLKIWGREKWIKSIVIGVCMVAFLYGVFVLFLHVPVPKGPLGF